MYEGESLRGYSFPVMKRYNYICQYCRLDGKESLEKWVSLTRDHLLPQGYLNIENDEYIVTACHFCNTLDNHYFKRSIKEGYDFNNKAREELVNRRRIALDTKRKKFVLYWKDNVKILCNNNSK